MLGNMLTGKAVMRAGKGVGRAGKAVVKAGRVCSNMDYMDKKL